MVTCPKQLVRSVLADRRGVSTVEFALVTVFILVIMMGMLDLANYILQKQNLEKALSETSVSAFASADNVPFANIPTFVRNSVDEPATTVTVTCNGNKTTCGNTSRTCACLSTAGTFSSSDCTATCSGASYSTGARPGYFVTIAASYDYDPMIMPSALFGASKISASITVRLQ